MNLSNLREVGRERFKKVVYLVYPEWVDCVDYLDNDFFTDTQVAYQGDANFYFVGRTDYPLGAFRANFGYVKDTRSLMQKIFDEREYRDDMSKLESSLYRDECLQLSEEREFKLLGKMERESGNSNIEKARGYPIDEIIDFKHGFAKCLWHDEKSPSLHHIKKENLAHCFGCNETYDSIDAAQKVWGLSFTQALKKLM